MKDKKVNMKNKSVLKVEGYWRDEIIYENGEVKKTPHDKFLNKNLIVDDAGVLMAGLFMGDSDYFFGDLWLAVGNGLAEWDDLVDKGVSNQTIDKTQLFTEIFRKQYADKNYITAIGGTIITNKTKFLQYRFDFNQEEISGEYLREFGLFGGDAIITENSGKMFDYVIHPVFYKNPSIKTVKRFFEIKF